MIKFKRRLELESNDYMYYRHHSGGGNSSKSLWFEHHDNLSYNFYIVSYSSDDHHGRYRYVNTLGINDLLDIPIYRGGYT